MNFKYFTYFGQIRASEPEVRPEIKCASGMGISLYYISDYNTGRCNLATS